MRAALGRVGLEGIATAAWIRLRRPELVAYDWGVWSDYARFKSQYRFLRESTAQANGSGRVLVVSLSDFVAQVKAESMLAKALQLRGCEPVIVTHSTFKRAHRLYRVFGFDGLVYFDRYIDQVPAEIPRRLVDEFLGIRPTLERIKAFTFHEVDVGRQALASILRFHHVGRLDLDSPAILAALKEALLTGITAVLAAEGLLDEVRPTLGLINDAMYVGIGGIFESALNRRIPVIQWVGSQRDDALALKRFDRETHRVHPISLSNASWRTISALPWTPEREAELSQDFRERYVESRWTSYYNRTYGELKTPAEIRNDLGMDPGKKTATIFAHILWDSTMFWGEDLFDDYQDWLVETLKAAAHNTAVNWVVKLHPGNIWKSRRDGLIGESVDERVAREAVRPWPAHIKLLPPDAPLNTYSVLQASDYCLTVRGTVGIEAAALGIPVLTAGTGRYSGLGFTVDFTRRDQYLRTLERIQDLPRLTTAETELAKKYAHALFVLRPARFDAFQITNLALSQAGHPLDHNVVIRARSMDDLRRAVDLCAFAEWAIDSRDADFLASPREVPVVLAEN